MAELNETLVMTTCKCREGNTQLVMSRAYFDNLIAMQRERAKFNTLDEVIRLLDTHREQWFHQSLTAGSATFWNNKVSTVQQLINEVEEMKCQK